MSHVLGKVVRRFASSAGKGDHDLAANELLWKRLTFFVAFPALILVSVNTYLAEVEHKKHFKRAEFINYDHLRLITKPFPWGDGKHSLFFNKEVNCTRDGYED